MPGCLIATPSANIAPTGTPSWATGTEDTDYPLTNSLTLEPDDVSKANETTATYRLTFGGAELLVGLVVVNTNAGGTTATLTNNAGMTPQAVVVPASEDGLCQNIWFDLREVTSTSATQWNVAFVGTDGPVALGTVLALTSWLSPRLRWEYNIREAVPNISHRASRGKRWTYETGTRVRFFEAEAHWAEDVPILRSLRRETRGSSASLHPHP